jgi:hypothetical protein
MERHWRDRWIGRGVYPEVLRVMSAVWFAGVMGLLDDAIREHMELKRLHGADPGELASEERDALGHPAPGDENTPSDVHQAEREDGTPDVSQPTHKPEFSDVGGQTAELDMRAVLDAEDSMPADTSIAGAVHPASSSSEKATVEESLEWEIPGDRPAELQRHDRIDEGSDKAAEEGPVEDVLEETPDFLRDTPEQERLWFEQQPPRDFDFDK